MKKDWYKTALYSASIVVLGFGLWGGLNSIWYLFVTIIAAGVILFFANLDRVSEFKASQKGFEAKTREIINEAKIATKDAQQMTKIMGEAIISLTCRTGRWSTHYTSKEIEDTKNNVSSLLNKFGTPSKELDDVFREYVRFMQFDYISYILSEGEPPKSLSDSQREKWRQFRKGRDIESPFTPEDLKLFLNEFDLLTVEASERIKDYEYFQKKSQHRRPDVFFDRSRWKYL